MSQPSCNRDSLVCPAITWAEKEIGRLQALLMDAAVQLRQSEYPFDWGVAAKCEKAASTYEQSAPEGDNDPNGNRELAREIDGS